MRTLLALLVLVTTAIHTILSCAVDKGNALRCHTCVAGDEDECNRQGISVCPPFADACSTIAGSNTVAKSCTYRAFCDKTKGSSGVKMDCCFTDECNGPHRGHSHGGKSGAAGALGCSPALILGTLLVRLMVSRL